MDSSDPLTRVLPPLTRVESGPTGTDPNLYNGKCLAANRAADNINRLSLLNGEPSGSYPQLPSIVPGHEVQMGMGSLNGEPSGSYPRLPSIVPLHEIRMGPNQSIFRPGNGWEPIMYEAAASRQPMMAAASRQPMVAAASRQPTMAAASRQPMMPPDSAAGPVNGETPVCGVYSPEIKKPQPKVKGASCLNFKYECPRCHTKYSRRYTVKQHFPGCIVKYGNPDSLKWSSHDSTKDYKSRKENSYNQDRKQIGVYKRNRSATTAQVLKQQDK